jgi:hypothetical protein
MKGVERIEAPQQTEGSEGLLAIVVRDQSRSNGVHFVTDIFSNQQVAVIRHPAGHEIKRHRHQPYKREIHGTTEVLIVQRGLVDAAIYTSDGQMVCTVTLEAGDLIVLVSGGHEFFIVDTSDIIEVKQGPYDPTRDKVHF